MSRFRKERLTSYAPYTPGEQPKDMEFIKLNTNESPYPPAPRVLDAIKSEDLEKLRLYPDPDQGLLLDAILAGLREDGVNLGRNNIMVSNGSDDIINFAFLAYAGDGVKAVYPDVTYGFYDVFSDFQNVEKKLIPLKDDFSIDPADYIFEERSFIVIANPNAPTGKALSLDEIELIVSKNPESVVLIDEAYIDFGGETAAGLISKYDNLLVSRTFSKSASLAGARLRFALGNEELINDLKVIKDSTNPYAVNRMTALVGIAAMEECGYYKGNCKMIAETRDLITVELRNLGLNVIDSSANFLMVGTGSSTEDPSWQSISGEELYLALKERGILVRWFSKDRIKDYVRISIGLPKDMRRLMDELVNIKMRG